MASNSQEASEKHIGPNGRPEIYPLDDTAIALLTEMREQIKNAQLAMNTVIAYFARQHKLTGQIRLADNGRELIIEALPAAPQPKEVVTQ